MHSAGSKELQDAISKILSFIPNHMDDLNEFLLSIKFEELSVDILIAYIRTAFVARTKLKDWSVIVENLRKEIIRRGVDMKIFHGII